MGSAPSSIAVGDFKRDGKADLTITHQGAGGNQVAVLLGTGLGASFAPLTDDPLPGAPQSVTVSDVDGDGDDDLVVASSSANVVSALLNSGTGTFATRVDYATGTLPTDVAVGKLSLDGRPDILVSNTTTANTSVLLNGGSVLTGVEAPALPAPAARLAQNAPNPFNPRITIRFHLETAGPARLTVFHVRGRRVATLLERTLNAGDHSADWDRNDAAGNAVASGAYFYRMEAPGFPPPGPW